MEEPVALKRRSSKMDDGARRRGSKTEDIAEELSDDNITGIYHVW